MTALSINTLPHDSILLVRFNSPFGLIFLNINRFPLVLITARTSAVPAEAQLILCKTIHYNNVLVHFTLMFVYYCVTGRFVGSLLDLYCYVKRCIYFFCMSF